MAITREVIADLYHNCNVEGFVLGKQELFFQQDDYTNLHRPHPHFLIRPIFVPGKGT